MHIPVLQKEVIECLDPKTNENFIDCTVGGAGHSLAILERTAPRGKMLGIDMDSESIKNIKKQKRLILVCDNFVNLKEIVKRENFTRIDGILFDLGLCSWQLDKSGRGFSFQKREPLDMRYSQDNQLTAEKILNFWSKFEIEKILREYGEEMFAKNIAEKIIESRKTRPIKNTIQLVSIIEKAVPKRYLYQRIHFATRTFQALRIAVNDELNNLEKALPQALDVLRANGRIVAISFHSLEDRIVKNFLRDNSEKLKILTKKPVMAENKEVRSNPRSRSAKLRAAIKL